ncbi:F-box/LRR-repeat protein At3g58900-like [Aegilops tauschii subsp. strangulata]|uniref:F-box/LRR-repeat protein At3g58900-like n=1 Tax=Aegilops tauschii subsp. strangulata TaxID=200361 RepID=UPI00098B1C27|nr:putative F-box/LRR-repeat protein At3g28410 [Aegilops tauschii subsp. strangulata]
MASGADRISGLYDELLHHVLSFLPAHEAVRTCVLARRWRHPWKSPPRRCASPALSGAPTPRGSSTSSTLHNLLLLRDPMARLDSFELDRDFGCKAFLPANEAHVNMWFRHAAMCGPRALLALRTTRGIYRHGVDDDPQRLAGSPTSLSNTLDFSGCPTLLHLKMEDCEIAGNISSPFLKHLSITECYFHTDPFRGRICCADEAEITYLI